MFCPAADGDRRLQDHPLLGALPEAPPVHLTFDGRAIEARGGEPIVAALIAAGVRVFRTMPGSGEARGGWCMVGRCGDCAVVVDGRPDVPACVTVVAEGMAVRTQHGHGGDGCDFGAAASAERAAGDVGGDDR